MVDLGFGLGFWVSGFCVGWCNIVSAPSSLFGFPVGLLGGLLVVLTLCGVDII